MFRLDDDDVKMTGSLRAAAALGKLPAQVCPGGSNMENGKDFIFIPCYLTCFGAGGTAPLNEPEKHKREQSLSS